VFAELLRRAERNPANMKVLFDFTEFCRNQMTIKDKGDFFSTVRAPLLVIKSRIEHRLTFKSESKEAHPFKIGLFDRSKTVIVQNKTYNVPLIIGNLLEVARRSEKTHLGVVMFAYETVISILSAESRKESMLDKSYHALIKPELTAEYNSYRNTMGMHN